MAKAGNSVLRGARQALDHTRGIFGPDWPKWRGAIMRIALVDEPPFVARFEEVVNRPHQVGGPDLPVAKLLVLDETLRPVEGRTIPWPPNGEVRVLRTP